MIGINAETEDTTKSGMRSVPIGALLGVFIVMCCPVGLPKSCATMNDTLPEIQPDQPAAFLVGQASPMDKVFREASDFDGSFTPRVRIAAAGRERESFQLVLLPLGQPLRRVHVEISDLLHENGRARLPTDRVAWYPVGYVQTRPSVLRTSKVGWWWPDILLPPDPFEVEVGFVQPVWFTVDVPADTEPGVYRGLISFQPEGLPERTVALELTVRPFALPLRGKLKTAVSIHPGIWERWYGPDGTSLPPEKWQRMYDFLLAHRLNPISLHCLFKNGRAHVVPRREDMQYCYNRGMNATCLASVQMPPQDPQASKKYLRDLEAWLADWNRFINKNWTDFTWFIHGFDESDMRSNHEETVDPSIRRIFGMIGEKFPRIKRESTNPLNPAHVGLFDIWTPRTDQWNADLQERQAVGDEVWAYICCAPGKPYANMFIDFPGVDPRILLWQFYQHRLTGLLYWMINYYVRQENWNAAGPKWPERPWNPLSFSTNSDGILIYPGPDATPLASTRLENLRDGIEDYEALALLADLMTRLERTDGHGKLVAQAREVLAVRPEVSRSWTDYAHDPERIVQARAEADRLIEAILKALGDL